MTEIPTDDIGNLYPLFDKGEDDPPVVKDGKRVCIHRNSQLDGNARRVYCRECGVELDPFEVLDQFAREYERHRGAVEALEREERRLRKLTDSLKREERNVKARIRRREPENPAVKRGSIWRNHEGLTREALQDD